MEDLAQALLKGCTKEKDRQVVSLDVCKAIAEEKGIPLRDVELAALNAGIVPKRYERNIGTLGIAGQIGLFMEQDRTEHITEHLQELGFTYVTLDMEGYKSKSPCKS